MDRAQFYKEVYSITKEIPYGNVFTYGKIAQLIGNPQYSRMVGQALSHAPKEEDLPCHRIVNSQGRLVPSWQKQKELLEKEGITFKRNGCVNMSKRHYKIFCVNGNTGFRNESRIFYFIHLQNEEAYERKESSSA